MTTNNKSRRKLRSARVNGKVYPLQKLAGAYRDMGAPRVRSTNNARAFDARANNAIAVNASNRNVRVLKSGKRKLTF